jgi:DNA-directed RNA polymerase subunit M/transcription elongation factor TFIIS
MSWFGKKDNFSIPADPEACPQCGSEDVWYVSNETDRHTHEIVVEIWQCRNGHTFRVTIRS